jgi:hypothetical protein
MNQTLRRIILVTVLGTGASALALGSAGAAAPTRACTGPNLSGSFSEIPGSAGAGHISYRLTIKNKTAHKCFVEGQPKVRLLDRHGHSLPSHVVATGGTAHKVVIAPGHTAFADARFSPDVPGSGDHQTGKCQPTAFRARISPRPGGGKTVVPVSPHTSVCEQGTMQFRPFHHGT